MKLKDAFGQLNVIEIRNGFAPKFLSRMEAGRNDITILDYEPTRYHMLVHG